MIRTATLQSCRTPSRAGISLFSWASLWKSRRDLARLDAHLQEDLGLNDHQIRAEINKPVWDVPQNWRR